MENKETPTTVKLFIGFGIITVLSGLYLIYKGDYVSGIAGTIVGLGLVFMNKIYK